MRRRMVAMFTVGIVASLFLRPARVQADPRTEAHQQYAATLWAAVTEAGREYTKWRQTGDDLGLPGPADSESVKTFLSSSAARNRGNMPYRSVVVTEHLDDEGNTLAVTVRYKGEDGYDARYGDWYWAHYLPDGKVLKTSADKHPFCKPGFVTVEDDGRVWVFPAVCGDLVEFFAKGEPAKCVIRPGAGPMGVTLKSSDNETIDAYVAAQDGFETFITDGRIWVFPRGCPDVKTFKEMGESAKFVTRPGAGPGGMTVRAPDAEIIDAYLRVAMVPQP